MSSKLARMEWRYKLGWLQTHPRQLHRHQNQVQKLYLNKHETDVVWRAKAQFEHAREFITAFLDGFDGPDVRAKEAVDRALHFRQKSHEISHMTNSTYLELKGLCFDEALREGNTAGHVDTRIRDEPERCRNAVEHLLAPIEVAVRDHLTDVSLAGHVIISYSMDHFTEWTVMAKQVRRLAIHKRLDPKSSSSMAPYGKNMMKAQDSESEGEQEGRKNDFVKKNRWKDREARVAQDGERGGGGERRGAMLCCNLPNQSAFRQGDERVMPPRRPGGTANNLCVYHWHEVGCRKKGSCVYGGHVTKVASTRTWASRSLPRGLQRSRLQRRRLLRRLRWRRSLGA